MQAAALLSGQAAIIVPAAVSAARSVSRGRRADGVSVQRGAPRSRSRIVAEANPEAPPYVDYEGNPSTVFPREACDELGEEYCGVDGVFEEGKLPPKAEKKAAAKQGTDRETVSYDGPKTVFQDEACDDLGGEFCEPQQQ